jgi:DNA helicase II / ATP-dependent DNA helicase PcrA
MTIKISLNAPQQKAVHHVTGPLLVVAGAGSGKTRVITARITHLIVDQGVPAREIVALTFTNKAANEMKERIAGFIGSDKELPFVGTFHSYCVRILKENSALLENPFISILDEDDKRKLLSGILHRANMHKELSARQAGYQISNVKNKLIALTKPASELFDHPLLPDIYSAYEKEKRESKTLDFDDLLLETVRLFRKNKQFKELFQNNIRHVMVDEYQDTNLVQHELLKQMALRSKKLVLDSICAVGDEDQSIYAWRGATVTNMLNFKKDFTGTTRIAIEQNYRSVQPILETANTVIKNNTQRNPKKLWSERIGTNRIKLLTCMSEYQEADVITQLASIARTQEQAPSIAVLYRTHAQSRAIEESFLKHGIPYKIIGGLQFYERKEVKDLLAYLKLIANPFDRASLFRILNTPARGFGAKFEEKLYTIMAEQPFLTFKQASEQLSNELPPAKRKALTAFLNIFEGLEPESKPRDAANQILNRIEYTTYLKKTYEGDDAQTRIENVNELMNAMSHFETEKVTTISAFLDEVALMQEKLTASDDKEHKVLLMTLHAAKGLEFDIVVLAGLEEGILPTSRALYENDDALEEERRLFYVGITRAKNHLLFSHAKFRYTYGQMVDQLPSQFLDELPKKHVARDSADYWNHSQIRHFCADWLGYEQPELTARKNQFASLIQDKINTSTSKSSSRESLKITPSSAKTVKRSVSKKASLVQAIKEKIANRSQKNSSHGTSNDELKRNQPVRHKTFGVGLVQSVEKKNANIVVTVNFKSGIKKIMSRFLQVI